MYFSETMPNDDDTQRRRRRRWIVAAVLLAVAVFMYASIMYKIVNFGA